MPSGYINLALVNDDPRVAKLNHYIVVIIINSYET